MRSWFNIGGFSVWKVTLRELDLAESTLAERDRNKPRQVYTPIWSEIECKIYTSLEINLQIVSDTD